MEKVSKRCPSARTEKKRGKVEALMVNF